MTETKRNPFKWFVDVFCKKWIWESFCVNLVYKKFDKWKGWLYLSPAMILLAIFTFWPIINTLRMAFTVDYDILAEMNGATFEIGFGNFANVFANPNLPGNFVSCLKNTMILCFITVPLSTILALVIAVCLNAIKPLQRFLQTIFFLPYVTNSIAIGMVFAAMFNIVGNARIPFIVR